MKKDIQEILPSVGSYSQSRDEYINTLEKAVKLYQREVENLRSQLKPEEQKEKKIITDIEVFDGEGFKQEINSCLSEKCVFELLYKYFSKKINIIECSLFHLSNEKKLNFIEEIGTSENFLNNVLKLEEYGIIDWAVEKKFPSIIPNTGELAENMQSFILLVPLINRGLTKAVFIGKIENESNNDSQGILDSFVKIADIAAASYENLTSSKELSKMNHRLNLLNIQMLQTSKLASIGELAASIAFEIETPIKIIKANLKLFESGEIGRAHV